MALREFMDPEGRRWRVWETIPARTLGLAGFANGWLTFDDGVERRRLAPVPEDWAELTDERLALLVRVAQPSPSRTFGDNGLERRHAERRIADRRQRDRRERDRRQGDSRRSRRA